MRDLSPEQFLTLKELMPKGGLDRWQAAEVANSAVNGPALAVILYWRARTGGTGLSPFALAGISGINPRLLIRRIAELNRPLQLGYCTTSLLPIYSPAWGILQYRNYHQEDLEAEFRNGDLGDAGETQETYELDTLLAKYGSPRTWRKHCTRIFDPFQSVRNQPTPQCWDDMKALWKLVTKVTKLRV